MTLDEMDKLAAEKIMGMVESSIVINDITFYGYAEPGKEYQRLHTRWSPTRNIAQAWELLADYDYLVSKSKEYRCLLVSKNNGHIYDEKAETAPLAITKACLNAVGVEV